MSTADEHVNIARALTRWFQSQQIDATEASFIMVMLAGTVAGLAANDSDHLEQLLERLLEELSQAGFDTYEEKKRKLS